MNIKIVNKKDEPEANIPGEIFPGDVFLRKGTKELYVVIELMYSGIEGYDLYCINDGSPWTDPFESLTDIKQELFEEHFVAVKNVEFHYEVA